MKKKSRNIFARIIFNERGEIGTGQGDNKDTVSKADFEALQAQLKDVLGANSTLKSQLEEQSKLVDEFKNKELENETDLTKKVDHYKSQFETVQNNFNTQKDSFQMAIRKNAIINNLKAAGCEYTQDAIQLFKSDIKEIPVNDNFEADSKAIENLLSKAKTEKPFLFKVDVPPTSDVNQTKNNGTPISGELSIEDMKNAIREQVSSQGEN